MWSITLSRFLYDRDTLIYDLDVQCILQICRPPFACCIGWMRETYEFDGDLLVVQQVCSLENYTKRTLSDFLADSIMDTDDIGG